MSTPIIRSIPLLLLLLSVLFSGCNLAPKADQDASFVGGEDALQIWLTENIRYPDEAVEFGIEGRVLVSFVVSKDGLVKNVAVREFVDPLLDKEALRVVQSMPRWNPKITGGKPVNSIYNLPISFKLEIE